MGKNNYKNNPNIPLNVATASTVLMNATKAQNAQTGKYIHKGGFENVLKDFQELPLPWKLLAYGTIGGLAFGAGGSYIYNTNPTAKKIVDDAGASVDAIYDSIIAPFKNLPGFNGMGEKTITAASKQKSYSPDPVATPVVNATFTPTPTHVPEKYVLNYDGLPIIGTKQFIHDIVMVNEFAKKYSPADYEVIIKGGDTGAIKEHTSTDGTYEIPMGGGGSNSTLLGQNYLNCHLRGKDAIFEGEPAVCNYFKNDLVEVVRSESHENVHNTEVSNNGEYQALEDKFSIHNDGQQLAMAVEKIIDSNFSGVTQQEKDDFVNNFDFSEFEKQIQVYK